ncbi:MAG: ABC transporter permease subunit [Candidatus Heimdallarchaeota archaeon]|nr:MAG: ABC transporter permease subunit [Candidatus Heimdallarchaeota archaeon]
MLKNENLNQITLPRWNQGFNNLFRAELSRWFKKKVFLVRLLLWCGFTNGMAILIWLQAPMAETEPIFVFGIFAGLTSSIGITIIMQESIVGEIKSGTASWILSKPITRKSYIFAKWIGNSIGAAISMIFAPTLIFYVLYFFFTGEVLNLEMFLPVFVVLSLNMLFFLTFTLMMGSFQQNTSLVIGVPIAFYVLQQILFNFTNSLIDIVPWGLTNPLSDGTPSIVVSFILGVQPFSLLPIFITSFYVIVFVILAIINMQKQDI